MLAHAHGPLPQHWTRRVTALPGGQLLRNGFRSAQTWLQYAPFQRFQQLLASAVLQPLVLRSPRLAYKYLVPCLALGFSPKLRLACLTHHYAYWSTQLRPDFFACVLQQQVLWQAPEDARYTIAWAYPMDSDCEGELSVVFRREHVVLYTVTFTYLPAGALVTGHPPAVLVSRVQGTRQAALLKEATRQLQQSTPAALLLQAVCGIAQATGRELLIGVGTKAQLSQQKTTNRFDYDAFWRQLCAEPLGLGLFLLPVARSEKPLSAIKAAYRGRTLRKRQYKSELREAVRHCVEQQLLPARFCERLPIPLAEIK